jgi:hypothetical protein
MVLVQGGLPCAGAASVKDWLTFGDVFATSYSTESIRKKFAGSQAYAYSAFHPRLPATRLGAHIPQHIPLPVEARDKHRPAVLVATRLVIRNCGRLIPDWSDVTQRLTEAAVTELFRAPKKLHRIIHAERSQQKLHGPVMLVAQGQDVSPHGAILASTAKQNRRPKPPVHLQ